VAVPIDDVRSIIGHAVHPRYTGGSTTLSVTDDRWRGGDKGTGFLLCPGVESNTAVCEVSLYNLKVGLRIKCCRSVCPV
jgi:hypothetical protein